MKTKTLRILIPVAIGVVVAIGFAAHIEVGNLSSFGWQSISMLCPLGALSTMLAAKTFIPRAVIGLLIGLVLAFLLGRAFCGWICPVPVTKRIPELFKRKGSGAAKKEASESACVSCKKSCSAAASATFDSRHLVLLGALLTATVFGFPVFCLICPIGLSFATLFLVIALFTGGDITWGIVVVPALLLLEVTVFRRWCSHICPLGALMSLVNKPNKKILLPKRNAERCLETQGKSCGRCAEACEVHIDPRDFAKGSAPSECIKCRACVDVCPANAMSLPLVSKKDEKIQD